MEESPVIPEENEQNLLSEEALKQDPAIKAILDAVPDEKKKEVVKAITVVQQEIFSGPIPHPRLLAEYEKLMPGSTDRFMKMAETQQAHRIELEDAAVKSQLKSNERGQLFGFILSTLIISAAIVLFILGMPWFGVSLIGGLGVVLAVLFIRGKIHMDADLKNKKGSIDAQPAKE